MSRSGFSCHKRRSDWKIPITKRKISTTFQNEKYRRHLPAPIMKKGSPASSTTSFSGPFLVPTQINCVSGCLALYASTTASKGTTGPRVPPPDKIIFITQITLIFYGLHRFLSPIRRLAESPHPTVPSPYSRGGTEGGGFPRTMQKELLKEFCLTK